MKFNEILKQNYTQQINLLSRSKSFVCLFWKLYIICILGLDESKRGFYYIKHFYQNPKTQRKKPLCGLI